MQKDISIAGVLKLSVVERIQLVEDVWDSIVTIPEAVSLTNKQKEELDRRLKAYHNNPTAGSPWDEVKKMALLRK